MKTLKNVALVALLYCAQSVFAKGDILNSQSSELSTDALLDQAVVWITPEIILGFDENDIYNHVFHIYPYTIFEAQGLEPEEFEAYEDVYDNPIINAAIRDRIDYLQELKDAVIRRLRQFEANNAAAVSTAMSKISSIYKTLVERVNKER